MKNLAFNMFAKHAHYDLFQTRAINLMGAFLCSLTQQIMTWKTKGKMFRMYTKHKIYAVLIMYPNVNRDTIF